MGVVIGVYCGGQFGKIETEGEFSMKDKSKMTIGYQYRHMLLGNLTAVLVITLIWLMAFTWTFEKPVIKLISGIILTLVYFFTIYGNAGAYARHDKKSYTVLQPDIKKGFLMGLLISAVTLILFAGYKLVWTAFSTDGSLNTWWAVGVNMLFLLWTFPFFAFFGELCGSITWYGLVLMLVVPVLASGLGYFAVCKNFDLADKIMSIVYVKKDSSKKNGKSM